MRQRMIKPEFFDSESLASCTWGARLAFIGLMCAADDKGNIKLRLGRLRSTIFDDECTDDEFGVMLSELEAVDCIRIYTDADKVYINIPNFLTYQTINRPTKTTIPEPPKRLGKTEVLAGLLEHRADTAHGVAHGVTHGVAHAQINKERNKEIKGDGGGDADAAAPSLDYSEFYKGGLIV